MMEPLAIIVDGRALRHYPLGKPGFHGGTETYVARLAYGLAERGHTVHVLTADLDHEEQRGPLEWWWPEAFHPTQADVIVPIHNLANMGDLWAPIVIFAPNGIDPDLDIYGQAVSAIACFSECHADLLCRARPEILREKCVVTGLGVDLPEVMAKPVYGSMLYANDPARGLWHLLDIYDRVKLKVPEASLKVAYDFAQQFEIRKWQAVSLSELLWECKRRLETTPGVEDVGQLSAEALMREQAQCYVHVMPSDPPNVGSQIHGMTQMELAAFGVPLVLSDVEAFPEVFGEAATILPVPGSLQKHDKKRDLLGRFDAQDWADVVVDLMLHKRKWHKASHASRALAARHTWAVMIRRWQALLESLTATATIAA